MPLPSWDRRGRSGECQVPYERPCLTFVELVEGKGSADETGHGVRGCGRTDADVLLFIEEASQLTEFKPAESGHKVKILGPTEGCRNGLQDP